jgi:riboflavin kinase / FMN adenylyltransferase
MAQPLPDAQILHYVSDLTAVRPDQPTFLAIGAFDGVHRGHQFLLQQLVAAARAAGARAAALTFFPHPAVVIQGRQDRFYLTPPEERANLLAAQGLDLVITHTFNERLRQTRAAEFVDQLCRHLQLWQLWGGNFALGYKREGDIPFLRELGKEKDFTVEVVPNMVTWQGELVSSSRIRQALAAGDINAVTGCLGRPYRVTGTVIPGNQRGHTIGVPTANLKTWDEQLLPVNGVYATHAWLGEQRFTAATNIGIRPTVDGVNLTVEAHLLEFDGDLYGRELSLDFIGRIRDEQKFASLDELTAQIRTDIQQVRQLVTGNE